MNPNNIQVPYGQQMPMQPHRARHDIPYGQPPPHMMRPQQGYQPHYYAQPMGPMMPQYQHYPQQWYPYQQPMPQYHHAQRPTYYQPHMPPPPPPQMHPHQHLQHGPPIMSSQPPSSIPTPQQPPQFYPQQPRPQLQPSQSYNATLPKGPDAVQERRSSAASTTPFKADDSIPQTPATPATSDSHSAAATDPVSVSEPFYPPVPWLSVDDEPFPPKAPRRVRKILRSQLAAEPVTFPIPEHTDEPSQKAQDDATPTATTIAEDLNELPSLQTPAATPTPLQSDAPSEPASTQPTTPSSATPATVKPQQPPPQSKASRTAPVLPLVPVMPPSPTATRKVHRDSVVSEIPTVSSDAQLVESEALPSTDKESQEPEPVVAAPPPPPKSWAELVRSKNAATGASAATAVSGPVLNGLGPSKNDSLGDVLGEIGVADTPSKVHFLQPRGLVNTGNMCYMNSVLQVLVFCTPFYEFLDKVANKAAHAFKSNTPLIDALIMFMREYPTIDVASSVQQLQLRLKADDFEKYGDPLRPDFVYETINKLPRFRDMRRGHQQDAQEFLGFLLEELHEECAQAMQKAGTRVSSGRSTPIGSASNVSEVADSDAGWMEVGHKQKPAVTRSSGAVDGDSPVTNIFGGKLRSELKISGNKMSVTLEPYQPLQLDIGSPNIGNIVDALKGLTKPESMQGDFLSSRGQKATATKQVFIDTLPPVLILHLKRFQYDNSTKRAEKIWKKVGYPLELEIPREVFAPAARNRYSAHGGLPKYRLTGVIYHHGKNANGGHYTVDIRRQDGQEWIRLDDTLIRRVRSEDVAEGGSEEDPKVLAAALERHNKQAQASTNRFEQIEADADEGSDSEKVWSQVNGHSRSKSSMAAIVNGHQTPRDSSGPQTPRFKESIKDNKVAYLLFYQRISS